MKFEKQLGTEKNTGQHDLRKNNSKLRLMSGFFGAVALASTLDHGQVQAAEVLPTATFNEGVTIMGESALKDPHEVAGDYIFQKDEKFGIWLYTKGDAISTKSSPGDQMETLLSTVSNQEENLEFKLCNLHTHPVAAALHENHITPSQATNIRKGIHTMSLPPSIDDISVRNVAASNLAALKLPSNITVDTINGVVDPAGIIYHRHASYKETEAIDPKLHSENVSKDKFFAKVDETIGHKLSLLSDEEISSLYTKITNGKPDESRNYKEIDIFFNITAFSNDGQSLLEQLARMDETTSNILLRMREIQRVEKERISRQHEAALAWMRLSMTPDITPEEMRNSQEYEDMRRAYFEIGTIIRFVSHSEVEHEQPCAGVDYQ